MIIKNPLPSAKVADYVQDILVIENYVISKPFILPLYANGTPTLLFQSVEGEIKESANYLTLFGQTVFPETLTLKENFSLIAYFFKPHVLFSLFGLSAQELTDHPISLHLLSSKKAKCLQEKLLNTPSTERRIQLLDNYIYSLIQKIKSETQLIAYATQQILQNPNTDTLQKIQKELFITERSLQRLFQKNVGVSPNQFRRIGQFSAAFKQIQQRQFEKIIDVAYAHGYSDQSHFNRAFKEFTQITPKAYMQFGQSSDQ